MFEVSPLALACVSARHSFVVAHIVGSTVNRRTRLNFPRHCG